MTAKKVQLNLRYTRWLRQDKYKRWSSYLVNKKMRKDCLYSHFPTKFHHSNNITCFNTLEKKRKEDIQKEELA